MEVTIYDVKYKIEFINGDLKLKDEDVWGYVDFAKHIIYIDGSIHPDEIVNTIIHEILHIIVTIFLPEFTDNIKEQIVHKLTYGIIDLVKNNFELLEKLKKNKIPKLNSST